MEHKNQFETKKQKFNIYKFFTFFFLFIIILVSFLYLLNNYSIYKFKQGEVYGAQNVILNIANTIYEKGYITLNLNQENLTLVSSQNLQTVRSDTILKIMDEVQKNGQVTLYKNDTKITLIEYKN